MMQLSLMVNYFATVTPDWRSPVADAVASRWVSPGVDVRVGRASANYVCLLTNPSGRAFLRFNHVSERSAEDYESELAFVEYLAGHGLRVARPVRSRSGNLVEQVATPLGTMVAVLFEALEGRQYETGDLSPAQFEAWGRVMGELHALSVQYNGPARPSWIDHLAYARQYIPVSETAAWREMDSVERALSQRPADPANFGMIHYDFEQDNIVWQDNHISVLDFDDCARYWYAADVACALRDVYDDTISRVDLHHPSLCAFVRGYRTVKLLPDEELRYLPVYYRLQQLYTFARVTRSIAGTLSPTAPTWAHDLRAKLAGHLAARREDFITHPICRGGHV